MGLQAYRRSKDDKDYGIGCLLRYRILKPEIL